MADWLTGLSIMWGITPSAMAVFIGFFVAFAIALFVAVEFKKQDHEFWSDVAIAIFFMVLLIETALGIINWYIFIVLLIVFGGYEYYMERH